jgi:hypothetical protein
MALAIVDGAMGIMALSPIRYATVHSFHLTAQQCLISPLASATLVLRTNTQYWTLLDIVLLLRVCESGFNLQHTDTFPI